MAQQNTAKPSEGDPPVPPQTQEADAPATLPEPKGKAHTKTLVVERRRGFLQRWLGRLVALLIILTVLAGLALVGLVILLRSDLPRSLAESAATQALGLELSLGDLEIGWGGHITITDFSAQLPDFGQVPGERLLEVRRIEAELDSLPQLAINFLRGGRPTLKKVTIDSPTLYATESASGQWNFARAFTLVTSVRRGSGGRGAGFELAPLPDLQVTDGAMVIRTADGREARLAGFDLSGERENPLVYRLAGASESKLKISGELFPASGRRQQLKLELAGLDESLRQLFDLPEATIYATWTGGLTSDGVEGMLQIQSATADEKRVSGGLRIASSGPTLRIWPVELQAEGLERVGNVTIRHGEIRVDSSVHVENVLIDVLAGQVVVRSARFDPTSLAGEGEIVFRDLRWAGEDTLSGEIVVRAGQNLFGEPFADAEVIASGRAGETSFQNLSLELQAKGPVTRDWGTLDATLRLREPATIQVAGDVATTVARLEVPIHVRLSDEANPRIEIPEIRSLDPAGLELAGSAVYYVREGADHAAGEWWLSLWQIGLPLKLPRVDEPLPTQISLEASGLLPFAADQPAPFLRISQFFGSVGAAAISGSAEYVMDPPTGAPPMTVNLVLQRDVSIAPAHFEQVEGSLLAIFRMTGDPQKLEFAGTGSIETNGLMIGRTRIGQVRSDIDLTLTKQMLSVSTQDDGERFGEPARVLGAFIDLDAQIPLSADEAGHITLVLDDLDLWRVSEAANLPLEIRGSLSGRVHAELAGLSLEQAQARGWFVAEGVSVPGLELADRVVIGTEPPQAGAGAEGGLLLEDGVVLLPVEVVRQMEVSPGPTSVTEPRRMSFDVAYHLDRPRLIELQNIRAEHYPFEFPARKAGGRYVHLEFSTPPGGEMVIDLAGPPQIRGALAASIQMATGSAPFELDGFGAATMALLARDTRLEIEDLLIDLGEVGDITGGGTLDLSDLVGRSQLRLEGRGLNLAAMARELNIPEGAEGIADVSLLIQPGEGSAPRGEVMVDLSFSAEEARWRDLQIGRGQIIAYASRTGRQAAGGSFDFDLVTTDRVHLQVLGGTLDGYARLRNRGAWGAESAWHVLGTVQGRVLDLAQIGATLGQNLEGRVDLQLAAYGNLSPVPRFGETREDLPWLPVNGEATLAIRRAELRRFNLFNRIFEVTKLGASTAQQDWLDARVRLEQGDALVENLVANVDGVELRMAGRVDNVLEPREATIEATGVALPRPLSQLRLPFFAEADDILAAVQSTAGAATYRASGLLLNPNVKPAAWEEIGETLRVLLVPAAKRQ